MALADRLIGGRYRIVRKIAEGGMGEVFEAQHNLSKKSVALKILFPHIGKDEAARQRFLREVSAPAQIGHDAIVEVYDAGFDTEDGSLFVAMEYLEGEPLRDRLVKGAVPIEQLLAWFEAILDPLSAAHTTGIVHRDLKPENIFLQRKKDGSEVIKILDFGIARDLDSTQGNVTHTGIAMGTPHYMAPEQAMSAKGVSAAADVWALGAMLYEALAGRPPFDGETASAIVVNACTRQHAPLTQIAPHVSPQLAAFVDRCLDKEPRNRPQTAGDMLRDLRAVRGGAPMSGVGGAATPYQATGPAMHSATGPYGGATPSPGGYTPKGTAVLPMGGGTPPPGYGTSPPGFGHVPSGGGYGTGPAGFGSNPSAHGSWSGPGSSPGYATSSPSYGAPVGYATAAPASKGGGGMAIGVIAAVLLGGLVLVGGGIALVAVAMSGDGDSGGTSTGGLSTAQVRIETNVPAGELFIDGSSRGTVVPGQQFRIERGEHTVEIREGGSTVASGTVSVVPGSDTSVSLMRVAPPPPDPNVMVPGNAQVVTGQLRNGDEQDVQGKYIDRYPFDWTTGQQVQITLDSADFDTYLRVVSPSGVEQTNDDREPGVSLNSGLTVYVSETGRWTVIATSYSGNVTGDYTLSVR